MKSCTVLQIKSGKIVEGQEPPGELPPFSSGTFSASGREGTAVAPCGKVRCAVISLGR